MTMAAPPRRVGRRREAPPGAPAERVPQRTVPFDYAFRYQLAGEAGRVHNQTVTVSIEAIFTAVSIGYGAIPTVEPVTFAREPVPRPGAGSLLSLFPSQPAHSNGSWRRLAKPW